MCEPLAADRRGQPETVLRRDSLSDFNDGCKDFSQLRALILQARAAAMDDADAVPVPRPRLDSGRGGKYGMKTFSGRTGIRQST